MGKLYMQTLIKEVKWLLKYMKLIFELGTVSNGSDPTVETTSQPKSLHIQ